MNKNETLVKVLKRTMWGDWVVLRDGRGRERTIFIPKGGECHE
jgi:hypothetical protein